MSVCRLLEPLHSNIYVSARPSLQTTTAMALAESFLRTIHKLGLLPRIIAALPLVSVLLAAASVAWLMVLPLDGHYRNTYISENALMPGQVHLYFRESEWNHVRGYRLEVLQWDFAAAAAHNEPLETWLADAGLTVAHHHDTLYNTSTMYALMHAPRGDNTEAMVLVVPYTTSDGLRNVGGFALAPALARYFARMSIWSKNIIVVFPQDSRAVLRRWVEAYHTTLDTTAGSIEAAIVLEYPSDRDTFGYMEVFYEGLNGQLPNLDLINTATTIARNEGIKVSVQDTPESELSRNDYWARLRVLAHGILRLAVAGADRKSYGCEAFSGWQIQAITIRAAGSDGKDITQFGRIVDLTFRSVNNLLEKFHQSFFFYLLLSPTTFVSIGTYLPLAVLVAAAFFVSSIYSFARGVPLAQFLPLLCHVLLQFGVQELYLFYLAWSFQLLPLLALRREGNPISIIASLISVCIFSCGVFFRLPRFTIFPSPLAHMMMAFWLYFISMLVITLLIVHFSLALLIGLCALPLTFVQVLLHQITANGSNWKPKVKIALCLLVSCPLTVCCALGWIDAQQNGVVSLVRGLITSWAEMQSWTWFIVLLGWFPAWFMVTALCAFGDFSLTEGPNETNEERSETKVEKELLEKSVNEESKRI